MIGAVADDEDETKPSQIPLLDDIVDPGKPVRRRRPRREKNFDLNLEPDPPETGDLFAALEDTDRDHDDSVPAAHQSEAPASEPAPERSRESALRAQADEVVDRLVKEYANDIIQRLRVELAQLLDELDDSDASEPIATTPVEKIWDGPPLSEWDPWLPIEVARRLEGTSANWTVAGGWSIDLYLKQHSRAHEDIEIATPRPDFAALVPFFEDCELFTASDGETRRLRRSDAVPDAVHQIWVVERKTGKWRLDIMLEPGDDEQWVYRRDESLTLPRAEITLWRNNIPFFSPEIALLFKAKHKRDKDEDDFRRCLPYLTSDRRAWLHNALGRFHPEHDWLRFL